MDWKSVSSRKMSKWARQSYEEWLCFSDYISKDDELEDMYNDALDEEGPVKIAGHEYAQSKALKKLDLMAYRCGMLDYIDSCGYDEITLNGITCTMENPADNYDKYIDEWLEEVTGSNDEDLIMQECAYCGYIGHYTEMSDVNDGDGPYCHACVKEHDIQDAIDPDDEENFEFLEYEEDKYDEELQETEPECDDTQW